ncbi:hypothetical protein [uncultured Fibrobacter sp.]|uniref:type II restriction enzyme n=1 Tax=uncultured Fibrobacter sp. TaxID=261512 RepID=UPI0026123704|nr:hypothetical protein [uncultured Fibrobacter sp.]
MSDLTKIDKAWNVLFERFNILEEINRQGHFIISAKDIKKEREPRLMSKFDHSINLPQIFRDNKLAILPISRGNYIISNFNIYHKFEQNNAPIQQFSLPDYLQSITEENILSETMAINAAFASGILSDFFEDEELYATACGRMGSGKFSFDIKGTKEQIYTIEVEKSQIEIDSAYEGINYLSIIEAKRDLADDFLIRQLYYPYRTWQEKGLTKKIKPIFLTYSNGVFSLYEYTFEDEMVYNSLKLVKSKRYSIENTDITLDDIIKLLGTTSITKEPEIAFPQADKFERVINLCEILNMQSYTREQITQKYAFDARQTDYYTNAAQYLGLIKKIQAGGPYAVTDEGRKILSLPYKKRQLAYCGKILQHKVFYNTFTSCLEQNSIIDQNEIVSIMKNSNLFNIGSESTFKRRSSTIRGWINWIFSLFQGNYELQLNP